MEYAHQNITKVAQLHATDLLKRRWPNRYIGTPILSRKECVNGLIEIGAISKDIIELSNKDISLVFWFLSRINDRKNDNYSDDPSFYKSSAWRKLRYSVLLDSNGLCVKCGRGAVDGVKIHVDHIKPRSKYPELALDPSNLRVLCEDCNLGKSDSDLE